MQWIVGGGTQQQGRRQSPDQATADVTGEPVGAAQDYCRSPVAVSSQCAACDSRSPSPVRQPQDDSQNWLFYALSGTEMARRIEIGQGSTVCNANDFTAVPRVCGVAVFHIISMGRRRSRCSGMVVNERNGGISPGRNVSSESRRGEFSSSCR